MALSKLDGKVALVTGGATGIGRATALALAAEGAAVAINYSRSAGDAAATMRDLAERGVPALAVCADISDDGAVRAMVAQVVAELGRLDILVANAGVTDFVDHADLDGLDDDCWSRALAVNVRGTFYCCRAAAPELRRCGGSLVTISSVAGLTGLGSSIAYAASKAAVVSMTKSLARVLAPEVRVNSVAPGIVDTRWVAGREDHVRRLAHGTPLGRVATPEDVAEIVLALVLNARFVTGQVIVVDGGMFI